MWKTPLLPETTGKTIFGKPCGQLRTTIPIIHVFHRRAKTALVIHKLSRGDSQGYVESKTLQALPSTHPQTFEKVRSKLYLPTAFFMGCFLWGVTPNPTKGMIPLEPHLPAALVKGILLLLIIYLPQKRKRLQIGSRG